MGLKWGDYRPEHDPEIPRWLFILLIIGIFVVAFAVALSGEGSPQ